MADRKRSSDGEKETERILGARGTVSQGERSGGRLPRQVGSKDERKRAYERPAGKTRVTGKMKKDDSEADE